MAVTQIGNLIKIRNELKTLNKKVVFTNGVFDILHAGHVDYLIKAKELGDVLIVGINSDTSVKKIKGPKRPIVNQEQRAFVLTNLKPVDYVAVFEDETPAELISQLLPDVLVKGGDWALENIVGKDVVESNGGVVVSIPFVNFQSSSNIIETIIERYK